MQIREASDGNRQTPWTRDQNSGGSRISRRGGVDLVGRGVDSQGGYVSKILYVKMKELGPLGGARQARPLDPPMQNVKEQYSVSLLIHVIPRIVRLHVISIFQIFAILVLL